MVFIVEQKVNNWSSLVWHACSAGIQYLLERYSKTRCNRNNPHLDRIQSINLAWIVSVLSAIVIFLSGESLSGGCDLPIASSVLDVGF